MSSASTSAAVIPAPANVSTPFKGSRVAQHTHISGLGLDPNGVALPVGQGMVGQCQAREAGGIIVELVRSKKFAGKSVLLVGPPGTGKTAVALAIAKELGPKVPFCAMVASEIYSQEVKKTEILMENLRRSIGLRVKETKEVYEGEVVEMTVEETENPHGGFGKAVAAVIITLKTVKGTKSLKLPPNFHENLQKQKVRLGDVVYIESQTGLINRVGRSDAYATEFDLETEEFVPIPKGTVFKRREVVQDVTLHDLDVANSKPQGGNDIFSVISQFMAPKMTEITDRLRLEVNKVVDKYLESGMAELIPGVLLIDEAHMLDIESFTFLNRAIESEHSPLLILATNRGVCRVRGTDDEFSPHGIPVDVLDRSLIIKTVPFNEEESIQIISLRAKVEGIKLHNDALVSLGVLSSKASLRYCLQLMTPAAILAETEGRDMIEARDIKEVDTLYFDFKTSAKRLMSTNISTNNY